MPNGRSWPEGVATLISAGALLMLAWQNVMIRDELGLQKEVSYRTEAARFLHAIYDVKTSPRVREESVVAFVALERAHNKKPRLVRADLAKLDLSDADLAGVNFSGANLEGANLTGAKLMSASFGSAARMRGIILVRAKLQDAQLPGALLVGAKLVEADFSRADLSGAVFSDSDRGTLEYPDGADVSRAVFAGANLERALLCGIRERETARFEGSIGQELPCANSQ